MHVYFALNTYFTYIYIDVNVHVLSETVQCNLKLKPPIVKAKVVLNLRWSYIWGGLNTILKPHSTDCSFLGL